MVCSVTDKVRQERCLWEGAAYSLAKEVMKEEDTQELRTLRRLQLWEKAWAQQARHFTTLLCQADIRQVYTVSTTILPNTHNYHILYSVSYSVSSHEICSHRVCFAPLQQLGEVDECVRRWREGVMSENGRLEEVESALNDRVSLGIK